jgi:hypothetical protein
MARPDTTHPYLTLRTMRTMLASGALSLALISTIPGCTRKQAYDTPRISDTRPHLVLGETVDVPAYVAGPAATIAEHTTTSASSDLASIVQAAHIRRPEDGILLLQHSIPTNIIKRMDLDGNTNLSPLRIVAQGYRDNKIADCYTYTLEPWRHVMAAAENDPFHKKGTNDMRRSIVKRIATREHATRPGILEGPDQIDAITNKHQLTIIKQYCDHFERLDWSAAYKAWFPQGINSNEFGAIVLGNTQGMAFVPTDQSVEEKHYKDHPHNTRHTFLVPSNIRYVSHIGLIHTHLPHDPTNPHHAASPSGLREPLIIPQMPPSNDTGVLAKLNATNPLAVHCVVTLLNDTPGKRTCNVDVYLRNARPNGSDENDSPRWTNDDSVTILDIGNYPVE